MSIPIKFVNKIHACYINLERRQDRYEALATHLLSHKQYFRLNFLQPFIHRINAMDNVDQPSSGALNSYKSALQYAQAKHLPYLMVWEDDIWFSESIDADWKLVWSELQNTNWGVLFGATENYDALVRVSNHLLRIDGYTDTNLGIVFHADIYQHVIDCIDAELAANGEEITLTLAQVLSNRFDRNGTGKNLYLADPFLWWKNTNIISSDGNHGQENDLLNQAANTIALLTL